MKTRHHRHRSRRRRPATRRRLHRIPTNTTTRRIHTRLRRLSLIVIPLQIIRRLIISHYSSMALLNAEMDTIDGTTPTHPRHQQPPRKPSRPRPTYQAHPATGTWTAARTNTRRMLSLREIRGYPRDENRHVRVRRPRAGTGALSSSPAGRGRRTGCSRGTTAAAATCRSRRGTSPTAAPRPGQGAR